MHILVFGKDGQLGKAFKGLFDSIDLASHNITVQFIGRSDCNLLQIASLSNLLNQAKPNLIINAAAYTAVDKAEVEVEVAYAVNAKAPEIMAQYAVDHATTFLHYSADYVFDGNKRGFYVEGDLRNPLGIYGKSKAAGELAIEKVFANVPAVQYAIFRTSWVYGAGSNFIKTILRLAKERDSLSIIEDQVGVPTSADWLAAVSLDLIFDRHWHLQKIPSGIYHAVPSGETNWHGLACLAVQSAIEAGASLQIDQGLIKSILAIEYPLPAPRPMNSRMASDKLIEAIASQGDVSKLARWKQSWREQVQAYVHQLVKDRFI